MSQHSQLTDNAELQQMFVEDPDLVSRMVDYLATLIPELAADKEKVLLAKSELRQQFAGSKAYVNRRWPNLQGEVLELFNGRNATEVARKLGISRATVYRVLKQPGRSSK